MQATALSHSVRIQNHISKLNVPDAYSHLFLGAKLAFDNQFSMISKTIQVHDVHHMHASQE